MHIRPPRGVLVVLAALTLTAGCTDGGRAAAPAAPASAASPGDELAAAMRRTAGGSFRFTVERHALGVVLEGAADPAAKVATVTKPGQGGIVPATDVRVVGADYYVRTGGGADAGPYGSRWRHLAPARVNGAELGVHSVEDPTGVLSLGAALTGVERGADRTYRGTLDLSRAHSSSVVDQAARPPTTLDSDDRLTLPTGSPPVPAPTPFEAQVDADGRLVRFTVTVAAAGGPPLSTSVRYTRLGAEVDVRRPASGEVVEPQDDPYEQHRRD
jgi:hypothetical protein